MSAVSSHRLVMVRKDCRRLRIYIGNPRLPDSNVLYNVSYAASTAQRDRGPRGEAYLRRVYRLEQRPLPLIMRHAQTVITNHLVYTSISPFNFIRGRQIPDHYHCHRPPLDQCSP
jgi:hypothetical protein